MNGIELTLNGINFFMKIIKYNNFFHKLLGGGGVHRRIGRKENIDNISVNDLFTKNQARNTCHLQGSILGQSSQQRITSLVNTIYS
jgi:hypothetical protein